MGMTQRNLWSRGRLRPVTHDMKNTGVILKQTEILAHYMPQAAVNDITFPP